MEDKIAKLREQAAELIQQKASSLSELDDIRIRFLGKKGEFTSILRSMGALAKEDRPKVGKIINEAKAQIEELIAEKNKELNRQKHAKKEKKPKKNDDDEEEDNFVNVKQEDTNQNDSSDMDEE